MGQGGGTSSAAQSVPTNPNAATGTNAMTGNETNKVKKLAAGASIAADTATAIEYGNKAVATGGSAQTIGDIAHGTSSGFTIAAIALDLIKLRMDMQNPDSSNSTKIFDTTDIIVNVAALKANNSYVYFGMAIYDVARLIGEHSPDQCTGACEINNSINLIKAAPTIHQANIQGMPLPGYPGP